MILVPIDENLNLSKMIDIDRSHAMIKGNLRKCSNLLWSYNFFSSDLFLRGASLRLGKPRMDGSIFISKGEITECEKCVRVSVGKTTELQKRRKKTATKAEKKNLQ